MKYAKGPWKSYAGFVYSPEDKEMVCEMITPKTDDNTIKRIPLDIGDTDSWTKAGANMMLIQAAPELLKACEWVLAYLIDFVNDASELNLGPDQEITMRDALQDVIAKARGEA